MSKILDQIVYPGSDKYTQKELDAPGSILLPLNGEPLVRAIDTAYIMFQVTDVSKQKSFLQDFGLIEASEGKGNLYLRGYGTEPYIYHASQGAESKFLGLGLTVSSEDDLHRVSKDAGIPVEAIDGPGGGQRVRLIDPDGFYLDLVFGRELIEPLETRRETLPVNLPNRKIRINKGQRTPLQPSALERFGHCVLMVSDFNISWKWYRKYTGLLPTDVLCTGTGNPVLAFNRLDKGDTPADHHTLVLAGGPEANYMHSAFETLDQDAIGQGQQFLKQKGWKHFWGMGRHILGSQIFDYWIDPHGFEVEHYADGDVFDCRHPTNYHLMDRGGLWAWGNDVPAAMKPKPTLKIFMKLLFGGKEKRNQLIELSKAMAMAPRPWLK